MSTRITRDLTPYINHFGHIAVDVTIGRAPGVNVEPRTTGASAEPATVAGFLRELADDIEAAGEQR